MDMEDLYRLLRTGHLQAQGIVDTLDVPVAVLDQGFCVVDVNRAFCETFKTERDDTIGQVVFELGNGQWDVPALKLLLGDVLPKAVAVVGYEVTHDFPALGERTMLVTARRLLRPGHKSISIMVQFEDVTSRRRDEAARDLLLAETRHRMGNLVAVTRALATQTQAEGRSGTEYRDTFLGRFDALVQAQDLSSDGATDLADLIAHVLKPFHGRRIRIHPGAPVALSRFDAAPMALMLHELMTNAVKYGALSTTSGVVDVAWRVDTPEAPVLHLHWREEGGPPVAPPSRAGFGSRLLQSSTKTLRGTADLRFEPQGLNATFALPLA
jgi:two-component sensor histidine kinase